MPTAILRVVVLVVGLVVAVRANEDPLVDVMQPTLSTTSTSSGGWNNEYGESHVCSNDHSFCNIDRRDAASLTQEEFQREYYNKKPLIITNGSRNKERIQQWTRQALLAKWQNVTVPVGLASTLYQGREQRRSQKMKLGQYIEKVMDFPGKYDEPFYLFEWYQNLGDAATIFDGFIQAPYFDFGLKKEQWILALGTTGSGLPFHFHGQAWNEALFGSKRWFLYPAMSNPPRGYNEVASQESWVRDTYMHQKREQRPYECYQEAGEIFYVPEAWYHATISCGQTIAIASQVYSSDQVKKGSFIQLFSDGMAAIGKGDRATAIKLLEEAERMSKGNELVAYHLGRQYGLNGDKVEAHDMMTKAAEGNPQRAEAWMYLGVSEGGLGDLKTAEKHLRRALGVAGENEEQRRLIMMTWKALKLPPL